MHFLIGKPIPRRTFVRGMGATVALPFLDAMIPAGRILRSAPGGNTRLVAIEMVHGSAGSTIIGQRGRVTSDAPLACCWMSAILSSIVSSVAAIC